MLHCTCVIVAFIHECLMTLILLDWMAGCDIGGEVVALGPGVTSFAIGDKVLCCTNLKVRN